MPTTLGQLFLFLALVSPGLAWIHARERRKAPWARTSLRELAELVVISVAFDVVFLSVGLAVAGLAFTLDIGEFLTRPGDSYTRHPLLLSCVAVISLASATVSAWLLATVRTRRTRAAGRHHQHTTWVRAFQHADEAVPSESGIVFAADRAGAGRLVLAELDSGDRVTGICAAFTDEPGLEGKRDLLLLCPSMESAQDSAQAGDIREFNLLVVNEAHIRWFATLDLSGEALEQYVGRHAAVRRRIRRQAAATTSAASVVDTQQDWS
nr:hypothetical protein [uncultured bacterium]